MSVLNKHLNWSLLSNSPVLFLGFDGLLDFHGGSDSLSHADLLSCSHQFLCGLIRLIRTCGSFHNLQTLGVVEGIEASSQDLSALYPAAWNTSQGQPGGLVSEGSQKPPACFHLHLHHSYQGGSTAWSCQCGYEDIKPPGWQTFGEIQNAGCHCRSREILNSFTHPEHLVISE